MFIMISPFPSLRERSGILAFGDEKGSRAGGRFSSPENRPSRPLSALDFRKR
jgi:hypothetical protein